MKYFILLLFIPLLFAVPLYLDVGNRIGIEYKPFGLDYNFDCVSIYLVKDVNVTYEDFTIQGSFGQGIAYLIDYERSSFYGNMIGRFYWKHYGLYLGFETNSFIVKTVYRNIGKIVFGVSFKI